MEQNSKVCREKRQDTIEKMKIITEKVKTEKRNINEEERSIFDNLDREQEALLAQAETFEKAERVGELSIDDSRMKSREDILSSGFTRGARYEVEERNKAYAGWFLHGTPKTKPEYWRAAERQGINLFSPSMRFDFNKWQPAWEKRQQLVGQQSLSFTEGSAGGYTSAVDNQLMANIDVALKAYGNIFQTSTVIETPTGTALPWPTSDDTGNLGEQVDENGSIGETDMTFGQNVLNAYKVDSGFIKVSWELTTDSVLDLSAFIAEQSGIRVGRKINVLSISTGAGSGSGPTPILTSATNAVTSASATAIVYAELVKLYHSVDPLYRDAPGCCWVWHDSTQQALEDIVDGNSRPLWNSSLEGLGGDFPRTLKGKPYYINQSMPSFAAGAKVMLFGDLRKVIIRRVNGGEGGFNVMRFNELFAANGLVAYLTWMRYDSLLSDAGQHPVKMLTMHA